MYEVTLIARDTTGVQKSRDYPVTVTVTDVNERPDISENFDGLQEYMEIEYDSMGTRPDVHTFMAEDYDDMDTFTWSLLGADAAYLDIGATDGEDLTSFTEDACTSTGPSELRGSIATTRPTGATIYTITTWWRPTTTRKPRIYAVVVTVTDVNEVPEFTGTPNLAITYNENDITLWRRVELRRTRRGRRGDVVADGRRRE